MAANRSNGNISPNESASLEPIFSNFVMRPVSGRLNGMDTAAEVCVSQVIHHIDCDPGGQVSGAKLSGHSSDELLVVDGIMRAEGEVTAYLQ
jgi:hypothetical protein